MSHNRDILKLAIPNIISNISVPLLGTVDTALMGRLSELHIGAVGVGGIIFSMFYWNFGFLRMGTTGITARAFGAKDINQMSATLGRAILVALIIASIILVLQTPLGNLGMSLMNVSDGIRTLTAEYFFIRVWDAPATLMLYVLLGWFFGMQNAIFPLILTIVINVVNMSCSFYFIAYLGWEVDGVAWGTVIAQYVGCILAWALLLFKYKEYLAEIKFAMLTEIEALKSFFSVNSDLFIRTLGLTFSFGFFYSQSVAISPMILAVNVILLQYLNWMSYGIDGFAYAAESLVGKYSGAKEKRELNSIVKLSFLWGVGLAVFYSLVYGVWGDFLLRVFTNQADVIQAAQPFVIWMVIFPLISFACYLWDGIFIGFTATKPMRDSMIISLIIYLISHFLFSERFGVHGMWLAFLMFMAARGLILWLLYLKAREKALR